MPHAGQELTGGYVLGEDEPFARGATSEVWLCTHRARPGEFVAKVLVGSQSDRRIPLQIRQELEALTLLNAEDRAELFVTPERYGRDDTFGGQYVLIYRRLIPMRDALSDGCPSLRGDKDVHPEARRVGQSVLWIAQLALAFDALHVCGRLHRDGHINNVFVDPETGRAKLGDLGMVGPPLAADPDGPRRSHGPIGHPSSCAPSVLDDGEFERADDRYSVGHTAWTMLAGGTSPLIIRDDEPDVRPTPARVWAQPPVGNAEQTEQLRRVLLRACAERREDRHEHCRAMAREVARALDLEALVADTLAQAESISNSVLAFREATSGGQDATVLSEAETAPSTDALSTLLEDMERRDREMRSFSLQMFEALNELKRTDSSTVERQMRREIERIRIEMREVLNAQPGLVEATKDAPRGRRWPWQREPVPTPVQTSASADPVLPVGRHSSTPALARAAELVAQADAELDEPKPQRRAGGHRRGRAGAVVALVAGIAVALSTLGGEADPGPNEDGVTPPTASVPGTDTTLTTPTATTPTTTTEPPPPEPPAAPALNAAEKRVVVALRDEIGAQKGTSLGCRPGPKRPRDVLAHLRCSNVGGGPMTVTKFRTVAGTQTYVGRLADKDAERVPYYGESISGCFDDGETVDSTRGDFTDTWHNEDSATIDRGQLLLRRRGKKSPMLIWSIYARQTVYVAFAPPTAGGEQLLCRQYRFTV